MPSIEYDLRYLQAGLIDLEGYLLSKELYWPIGASSPHGDPPYPRLTLGGLLLARARLQAQSLRPEAQAEFDKANARLEATRNHWRSAWGQKASREFQSRLNLWRDFLEEYRGDPGGNFDRYMYEVLKRVMLELLQGEAENLPPQTLELLAGLDRLLQSVFVRGSFILDQDLMAGFPERTYWYLYGHPKKKLEGE